MSNVLEITVPKVYKDIPVVGGEAGEVTSVLQTTQEDAFTVARKQADDKKFYSLSLIRETEDAFVFQLYNKAPEPVAADPIGETEEV